MAVLGAILAIGLLILIHEAGHYLVARWCHMRVERFSIGFGPPVYTRSRRKVVHTEQVEGASELVAMLYRLAREYPRDRVGVQGDSKEAVFSAPELAELTTAEVRDRIEAALGAELSQPVSARVWEQTNFTLAPIPFGGFVQIDGMATVEEVDPEDERAYPNRPVWQRVATIFAGPGTNYLAAVVLGFVLYTVAGLPTGIVEYTVDDLTEGYDAIGKLKAGDRIVRVNGERLGPDNGGLPGMVQAAKNDPLTVTIVREGGEVDVGVRAKPRESSWWSVQAETFARETGQPWAPRYLIGIEMTQHPERVGVGIGTSFTEAFVYPVRQSELILTGLWRIVSRQEKGQVGGPVMITAMIKRSIDYGWIELVTLLMLLNVYLGLFNLLPLPALDGGRLAFLCYEIVTRRRPNPSVEQAVHAVGIMAFLVIMVLVTYKDILRLFS